MPTEQQIYNNDADRYERLIAREDYQGNILKSLEDILPLEGRLALDLGAGTGRLACLLAPRVAHVRAFDVSAEMLRVCRDKLQTSGLQNWQVEVADHRHLPVPDRSADLVVSGWSVSYLAVWNPETWREQLSAWMDEMRRVLRLGGALVLFESLGTGNEQPLRLLHLSNFYPWLDEMGFEYKWIRSDYQFESAGEAEALSRFFFGDELGDRVKNMGWTILPECTGVWWKKDAAR